MTSTYFNQFKKKTIELLSKAGSHTFDYSPWSGLCFHSTSAQLLSLCIFELRKHVFIVSKETKMKEKSTEVSEKPQHLVSQNTLVKNSILESLLSWLNDVMLN